MLYNVLFILKFMNELDKKLSLDLSRVSTNVEFIKKGNILKNANFVESGNFHGGNFLSCQPGGDDCNFSSFSRS